MAEAQGAEAPVSAAHEQPADGNAPLDLVHLVRQTMDDNALQAEVLALFVRHAAPLGRDLLAASETERRDLAHKLKGSAKGIGAFALADVAAALETDPADQEKIDLVNLHIGEVIDFIAAMGR